VLNTTTARTNLGLGTAATTAATDYATAAQGTLATNAVPKGTVTLKGDLFTATAASTPARLAVGANNTVLVADSVAATGNKWAAVTKAMLSTAAGEVAGAWTAYTPTWVNLTVGNGVQAAAYMQIGKTVHFRISLTGGTTSSMSGVPTVTIPVAAFAGIVQIIPASYLDGGVRFWVGVGRISGSTITFIQTESGSTGQVASAVTSPSTLNWFGNTDTIQCGGTYQAA
jgi:hypothetical protein